MRIQSDDDVHGYVERICFKTGPPRLVGAELEWIVGSASDPNAVIPIARIQDALRDAGPLPGGSVVTFEPGGQLELSSPPADALSACWRGLDADVRHIQGAFAAADLRLLPTALEPARPPLRQVTDPRYVAMEAYFDRQGVIGRVMMCSTAAVQVNLDVGRDTAEIARRWRILHAIGPAMIAAFANSPVHDGRPTGWKSTRQAVWQGLDPRRTQPPSDPNPITAWARYAVEAPVMLIRDQEDRWTPGDGMTFAGWLDGGRRPGMRPPSEDDLAYHLTTLFPPVRPRGWLEVRYIDAQPVHYWPVPIAVLTALTDVSGAGADALAASEPVAREWAASAQCGLEHPGLAKAARRCFEIAAAALVDLGAAELSHLVEDFGDRYVMAGRCPADDYLEELP